VRESVRGARSACPSGAAITAAISGTMMNTQASTAEDDDGLPDLAFAALELLGKAKCRIVSVDHVERGGECGQHDGEPDADQFPVAQRRRVAAMADTCATLAVDQDLHLTEAVVGVQEVALQRLFGGLRDREALRQFVDEQLGALERSDRSRDGRLIQTLEVLTACGGNKAEAAARLHIRRQSLYDRLDQITKLTGANLDDPRHQLPITVAFTVRTMLRGG
jgi:hypothetical protein